MCKCKWVRPANRSNLRRPLGPAYDLGRMRLAVLLSMMVMALGCASQSAATDRQMREQQEHIKRLSANCDRLEERVSVLEGALRAQDTRSKTPADAVAGRPDLPTVRVVPDGPKTEATPAPEQAPDNAGEDTRRLLIVGEGARVEARAANENAATTGARPSSAVNSRAPKRNQGTFPAASTTGAPK